MPKHRAPSFGHPVPAAPGRWRGRLRVAAWVVGLPVAAVGLGVAAGAHTASIEDHYAEVSAHLSDVYDTTVVYRRGELHMVGRSAVRDDPEVWVNGQRRECTVEEAGDAWFYLSCADGPVTEPLN